jgi:rubrerythrin
MPGMMKPFLREKEAGWRRRTQALEGIKKGKDLPGQDVFVCEVCGNTVYGQAQDKCSVCGAPKNKFTKIQ